MLFAALAAVSLAGTARAQGAFDFGRIPGLGAEPTVQIDLNPQMLAFVGEAARGTDPGAADAVAGLQGIRVYVYEAIEDIDAVQDFIDDASGTLERDGWQRTVFVQEGDEKVRIYTKLENNQIAGLTVMVLDGAGEAVFINVIGNINPLQLAQLMRGVGMDGIFGDGGGGGGGGGADPRF
jgi:hypothetical protein